MSKQPLAFAEDAMRLDEPVVIRECLAVLLDPLLLPSLPHRIFESALENFGQVNSKYFGFGYQVGAGRYVSRLPQCRASCHVNIPQGSSRIAYAHELLPSTHQTMSGHVTMGFWRRGPGTSGRHRNRR